MSQVTTKKLLPSAKFTGVVAVITLLLAATLARVPTKVAVSALNVVDCPMYHTFAFKRSDGVTTPSVAKVSEFKANGLFELNV